MSTLYVFNHISGFPKCVENMVVGCWNFGTGEGVESIVACNLGDTGTFWAQRITQEKSAILTKVLNHTKSSCRIFCTKKSEDFGLRVFIPFSLKVTEQFWKENQKRKISNIDKIFLIFTNISFITFYAKLSQISHFTYCPKYLLIDWYTILCHWLIYFRLSLY